MTRHAPRSFGAAWSGWRRGARIALVTLEDLWAETLPQNVPGTGPERPNWRRKVRDSFEQFSGRSDIVEALQAIDRARRQRPSGRKAKASREVEPPARRR